MNAQSLSPDPYAVFSEWMAEAEASEPNDPNAMCLATVHPDGRPASRMVLLKGLDDNGFVFYTNAQSHKGEDLSANPFAALCFYWKSLKKQVRIEGRVEGVSDAESDAYYASRHRGSRIGAWASKQSRPLADYEDLKKAVATYEEKFEGVEDIPRPPHWRGYRVVPERIEFWMEQPFRLHKRHVYTAHDGGWIVEMLYP